MNGTGQSTFALILSPLLIDPSVLNMSSPVLMPFFHQFVTVSVLTHMGSCLIAFGNSGGKAVC